MGPSRNTVGSLGVQNDMRKLFAGVAVTVAALSLSSCLAGPQQLQRTVDDWDHKTYVANPWLDAAMWVVPVFPLANFVAGIGDVLVGNAYHFWFHDAWDGKGTGFKHADVAPTDGHVGSLLSDGSWLKVTK